MLGPNKKYFGIGLNYTPDENPHYVAALISLLEAE
jgi:hypothetical protein